MADHREDEELAEEEVWAAMGMAKANQHDKLKGHGAASSSATKKVTQRAPTPPSGGRRSAPVSIPDWSKIYGRSEQKEGGGGEEYEEAAEERVPPHEWVARERKVTSFSVCEGAGRTLKGRDLSRVRNAVLSKTGFLE